MMWKLGMDEVGKLGHLHIFGEPSMQEGILDINLADRPAC